MQIKTQRHRANKCQMSKLKVQINAKAEMTKQNREKQQWWNFSGIKSFGFELTFGFCHLAFYCLYLLSASAMYQTVQGSVVILSIEKSQEPRKVTTEE